MTIFIEENNLLKCGKQQFAYSVAHGKHVAYNEW